MGSGYAVGVGGSRDVHYLPRVISFTGENRSASPARGLRVSPIANVGTTIRPRVTPCCLPGLIKLPSSLPLFFVFFRHQMSFEPNSSTSELKACTCREEGLLV